MEREEKDEKRKSQTGDSAGTEAEKLLPRLKGRQQVCYNFFARARILLRPEASRPTARIDCLLETVDARVCQCGPLDDAAKEKMSQWRKNIV